MSWYREGLRFKCTGCGKCCTGAPGYIWLSLEEAAAMARALNIPLEVFTRKYTRLVYGTAAPAENFPWRNDSEGALFCPPASPTPWEGLVASVDKKVRTSEHFSRENFSAEAAVYGRLSLLENPHNGDCVFLKNNACQLYHVRPKQCRTFPWWKENLSSPTAWKQAAKGCEGIDHPDAPLVLFQEIKKQLED